MLGGKRFFSSGMYAHNLCWRPRASSLGLPLDGRFLNFLDVLTLRRPPLVRVAKFRARILLLSEVDAPVRTQLHTP